MSGPARLFIALAFLASLLTAPLAPSLADEPAPGTDAAGQPQNQSSDQGQQPRPEDTDESMDKDEEADDIAAEQEEDEAMAEHLDGAGERGTASGEILQGLDSEYMDEDEAGQAAEPALEQPDPVTAPQQ